MKKNLIFFHLICFLGVFVTATLFLFYQVFVDSSFHKIPLKQFLKPHILGQAVLALTQHDIPSNIDDLFWRQAGRNVMSQKGEVGVGVSPESNVAVFDLGSKKYLTEISIGKLSVFDLQTKANMEIALLDPGKYEVLGWLDENQVILSRKQEKFSVIKINVTTKAQETVVPEINYLGESLVTSFSGRLTKLYYPDCALKCYFFEFDLEKNTVTKKLAAFTEPSHEASLSDVRLLFADASKGYIAYEVPKSNEVYVIDRDLNFLQYIRLENDRDSAHFLSYLPQTQQILFSLEERDGSEQTIALVAANSPSLHVLSKTKGISSVIISPKAGIYQIGNTLYDLNGRVMQKNIDGALTPSF